ncbi:MAG: oligosaccharide flippase family protein [Candidatus Omnitrophica bacterium]|nr:oligosaccharide flippase family protein [Candidatus Omnitrophota bacterium]
MTIAQWEQMKTESTKYNVPICSRRKGTIALMFSGYASLVLTMVKGIVLIPLYLHYIDTRLYGAWLATGSIVAYFGLCDFGISNVLVQRVASNYGKQDFRRLGSTLGTGLMIGIVASCLPVFLGLILLPWIAEAFHITGVEASQLKLSFLMAAVGTSLMLMVYNVGGVLIALQRQIVPGMFLVIGDILSVVVTLVLLVLGYGLVAIPIGALVWGISAVLGNGIYLWWFLKTKLPQVSIRFKKNDARDLSFQSVWQFGAQAAVTLARRSDNLIIAALIDPSFCVILTVTKKAVEILTLIVRYFVRAFLPSLAHLHGEGDKKKFKKISVITFKITMLAGICLMGGYLFFNKSFVNLWVGKEFFGGGALTKLLYVYGFFVIIGTNFYVILFAKGEMVTAARAYIAEALICVPLSICFAMIWGIKGIVVAGILAIISTSFWIQAEKIIRIFNISKRDILSAASGIGMQGLISLIVGVIFITRWKREGIVDILVFGCLYVGTVFFMGIFFDRKSRVYIFQMQKKLFSKYLIKQKK